MPEKIQNDMHNLSREVSCTCLQMFALNFDGDVGSPLCRPPSLAFFLPPFHTSFPQAFCSSATREDRMTGRTVQHSISVSEFLLRHGNAPTRLHTHTNTLRTRVRPLAPTHTAHVGGKKKNHGEAWSRLIFLFINWSLQYACICGTAWALFVLMPFLLSALIHKRGPQKKKKKGKGRLV